MASQLSSAPQKFLTRDTREGGFSRPSQTARPYPARTFSGAVPSVLWLIACLMTLSSGISNLHAAAKQQVEASPIAWQRIDIDDARERQRPILLYLYNPNDIKLSTESKRKQVFNSPDVKKAFAQFTPVMLPFSTTSWPEKYTSQARDGEALFVMTYDANPVAVFKGLPDVVKDKKGTATYPKFCAAGYSAQKANAKLVGALRTASLPSDQAVDSLLDSAAKTTGAGNRPTRKDTGAADENE